MEVAHVLAQAKVFARRVWWGWLIGREVERTPYDGAGLEALRLWRPPPPAPQKITKNPTSVPKRRRALGDLKDLDGPRMAFEHVGDVLERLDDCFVWLRQLKRWARPFYDLFAKTGTVVAPDSMLLAPDAGEWTPPLVSKWPSFMGMSFPAKIDDVHPKDRICPKLICCMKVERRGVFVPRGIVFYHVLLFYTRRSDKFRWPENFFVGASEDGSVVPLRMPTVYKQTIRRRGFGEERISHKVVSYPQSLIEFNNEWNQEHGASRTVEEFVSTTFFMIMSAVLASEKGAQINVSKADLSAQFAIPIERTAYFFRDRAFEATVGGARRKIFHAVRPHDRVLPDGRTVSVVPHFRGARKFDWRGHDVCITVPRHHHNPLSEFTAATFEMARPGEKFVEVAKAAAEFNRHLRSDDEVRGRRLDLPDAPPT
jgi:hypothetical protein